jgi:hypothetical protein
LDGSEKSEKSANDAGLDGWTAKNPLSEGEARSGHQNGGNGTADFPPICVHCGAPTTADTPVQVYAVDGEEYLLHRACQDDWLKEA